MDLRAYIRNIPDFPKPGIQFKDITPLLGQPQAFRQAVLELTYHFRNHAIDAVAAAEARGFLLAAPLALAFDKPLIPLRKPGKLPSVTLAHSYDLEYGSATLHMHTDALPRAGARVLLVDDLLATGGTMKAGCELVKMAGGEVVGCAFLVELTFLGGRARLAPYEVFSLIDYAREDEK
jgi:adenine phosphoribosyltransferase